MADTVRKMLDIVGTMFADGQSSKALTPQRFRDVVETLKTQYAMTRSAAGTFTTAAVSVWKALDNTTTYVGNGFSNPSAGVIQYDNPPVDSVSLANQPRSFLAISIASVEPLGAAPEEYSFSFGVDGTVNSDTIQTINLPTALKSELVVWMGVLPAVTNGQQITNQVRNDASGNNLTVNGVTTILIGLND